MSDLQIVIHPVGAGHAVHVFTPSGEVIVIDAGSSDDYSPLDWLATKTRRIDKLIISHPHGDHIREIEKLRHFSIERFYYEPTLIEERVREANQGWCQDKLDVYFELTRRYSDWSTPPATGTPTTTADNLDLQVFCAAGTGRSNLNNFSLVACVTYGEATAIIPGDNESPSWRALSAIPAFASRLANCHLFLTSHHGRDSGYCDTTFPALLQPRLCIVSDGPVRETNATPRYGMRVLSPHPVILGSGKVVQRRCVTTRDDGVVLASIAKRVDGTFVRVKVENG